jgi:hypothetical protein
MKSYSQRSGRGSLKIILGASMCLLLPFTSLEAGTEKRNTTDEELVSKIQEAKHLYGQKYREVEKKAGVMFKIDFGNQRTNLEGQMHQLDLKLSMIKNIQDPEEQALRLRQLEEEYADSDLLPAMQAYHYVQNEMEKDHRFVGQYLAMLEEIVDVVIQKDPMFRYMFHSDEFERDQGLILTRVVWKAGVDVNVSAVTKPLNLHSVFADKVKIPMLITITPIAFHSLAFLRSILLHEVNHAYMFRDIVFSDVNRFSGGAIEPAKGNFTHYFKMMNPVSPSYQYHLIHEYYSLKAQLLFDDFMVGDAIYKLDKGSKENIKQIMQWSYSQLNEKNKAFTDTNDTPPVFDTILSYYAGDKSR